MDFMDKKKCTDYLGSSFSQTSPCFIHVCSTRLLKTLWEKEKLLSWSSVTSTLHNILSKPLAGFPQNHCRNNRQQ